MNGGYGMQYDVLREFACHDGGEAVRLHAYVAFDRERAELDSLYAEGQRSFHASLRDLGYKVIQKPVKRFKDDTGQEIIKSNSDLDMAVDILLNAERLDRIVLVTGDGDFVRVVHALQERGCRVELVAFDNVSVELKQEVDMFMSGYLVPNLLPFKSVLRNAPAWGDMGSKVRGVCYYYREQEGYGFMRFLKRMNGNFWIPDTRRPESPFDTAYFHHSYFTDIPDLEQVVQQLPNRDYIFEFELHRSQRGEGWEAKNIRLSARP